MKAFVHSVDKVIEPSLDLNDTLRAVVLEDEQFAALPNIPTLYHRNVSWALAPVECASNPEYAQVVREYVLQKVLQLTGRGVLFVRAGVEVWDKQIDEQLESWPNEQVEKVVEELRSIHVPDAMLKEGGNLFVWLLRRLARKKLLDSCIVHNANSFVGRLKKLGVVDQTTGIPKNGKKKKKKNKGVAKEKSMADTAVCVTGQMRSAPFTSWSLRRDLHRGVGECEYFVVTELDDRVASSELFNPVMMEYSRKHAEHGIWVKQLQNSTITHETMSTERHLRNYLMQLADMKYCWEMVQRREVERGRRFKTVVRARPDTVLKYGVDKSWWRGYNVVVYGRRQSFYAMNDRFFVGPRDFMGRLLTCHDLFWLLVGKGTIYHRRAGMSTHMLWKKNLNSERYFARCAAFKRVPLMAVGKIDARRVAYTDGVARWREFLRNHPEKSNRRKRRKKKLKKKKRRHQKLEHGNEIVNQ